MKKITKSHIHEVLHTVDMVQFLFETFVVGTKGIACSKNAVDLACNISNDIASLYQLLGSELFSSKKKPAKKRLMKNARSTRSKRQSH